jgi:hypothetical protein
LATRLVVLKRTISMRRKSSDDFHVFTHNNNVVK